MLDPLPPSILCRFQTVCAVAAPYGMLQRLRAEFTRQGLTAAVAAHDTPALFDWLVRIISYQGVSDAIASQYLEQHGTVTWAEIEQALGLPSPCGKLRSHWHFEDCCYAKSTFTCAEPWLLPACSLPTHDLRNGRLNQAAYSLFLFLRDVCDSDLVGWLDGRLAVVEPGAAWPARLREAVLAPLLSVYGVSSKVMSMALADLLLAGDPGRERWVIAGTSMIVVDTLVHNWLHRTGTLREVGAEHPYGVCCYLPGGCAEIIEAASRGIESQAFCPGAPRDFPRLVQKAVWLFCSDEGLGQCNGNRIDDRQPCAAKACLLGSQCLRLPVAPRELSALVRTGARAKDTYWS